MKISLIANPLSAHAPDHVLGEGRSILAISKHGFTEDLGSHLLDSLGREEGEGLGCRDWRDTMPFEADVLYGIDFLGGLEA